ncbi:amidohydrolase [Cryobacterium sp. TMT1-2-2]|uniref:amidohydrolase family protein n=1 Tax=Cryobacterium sp. TMT1-2-2 TaxID=1259233 RepID=UPI00106A9642|nr:amidohydrolase family protein [Cryobacterium sp. TMT1-2-2]TFD09756.1 amidohydrolase [Cryobacterium sp. TMT1-2-2]
MPDLVLRSVRQPGDTTLSDLHITDGVITQIVPTTTTDAPTLDGRTVIPGLWDEHVHLTQWALAGARFDLSTAVSAREALELVRAQVGTRGRRAAQVDASGRPTPLIGVRFRDAVWADLPTLRGLDDVTQGHPTALISHDLHCVWINSAAAEQFGVHVDESGLLREQAAFDLTIALGQLPDVEVDALAAQAGSRAAARGVVGIVDFEMTWNRSVWQRRIAGGFDALRVEAGIYLADFDRAVAERMHTDDRIADTRGLLSVGPLKLLIDGSLNTRTAFCVDEYPVGGRGVLAVSEDELTEILVAARGAGLLPAVHAIGDAANTVALNAFERAALHGRAAHEVPASQAAAPADRRGRERQASVRGRIEHAQFLQPADFARFASFGVIASVQPEHALDDRDAVELNWSAGADRVFALRSLLNAGATLAFGSDAPVAPLDPFTAMSAATSRARSDGREPWRPDQVVSRAEALAASARARTRLQVGDVADIAILDGDPLTVSDATFERMPVAATLLAGRATHGAALLAP